MPLKNVIVETNIKINNAMVKKISIAHKVAKFLKISNFFEDLDSHDKALDW